jgi:hypothetical protein
MEEFREENQRESDPEEGKRFWRNRLEGGFASPPPNPAPWENFADE